MLEACRPPWGRPLTEELSGCGIMRSGIEAWKNTPTWRDAVGMLLHYTSTWYCAKAGHALRL